jgi:tetratricopeptide (TPR) repeat protein
MQGNRPVPSYIKIVLPLIILVLLNAFPASYASFEAVQGVRKARSAGRHAETADALRRLAALNPWRTDLWEQIGQAELAAGHTAQAAQAFQQARERGTLSAAGHFALGEAFQQMGDDASAERAWHGLLDTYGPSEQVYERIYQSQRERSDFAAAVDTLRAWQEAAQHNARPAFLLGLLLCIQQPEAALPYLQEAARLDTGFMVSTQTLRGGLALAGLAENPAYGKLLIGRAMGNLGHWDLALEAFQQALALEPAYAEAWAFAGEAQHHLGRGGKTELEAAYQLNPESPVVRALLSLYYRRHGQPERALPFLEAVAAQEPNEPLWQVEIGNTLTEKGDLSAARQRFEHAVEIAPNNSIYWQHLARFSIQNNYDIRGLGLSAARQAILFAPNDPAALETMGWAMLTLGDQSSAERFLQRAVEKDATYAPALLRLGQLHLQQQNTLKAREYLWKAYHLAADDAIRTVAGRLLRQYFGEGG